MVSIHGPGGYEPPTLPLSYGASVHPSSLSSLTVHETTLLSQAGTLHSQSASRLLLSASPLLISTQQAQMQAKASKCLQIATSGTPAEGPQDAAVQRARSIPPSATEALLSTQKHQCSHQREPKASSRGDVPHSSCNIHTTRNTCVCSLMTTALAKSTLRVRARDARRRNYDVDALQSPTYSL